MTRNLLARFLKSFHIKGRDVGDITISLAYETDRGLHRAQNEDLGCAHQLNHLPLRFLGVADGMGGHAAGEIASLTAIEVLESSIGWLDKLPEDPLAFLESVFHKANERVYKKSQQADLDMGTTLTAGMLIEQTMFIAHVGDSRAYSITREYIEQITEDHSWVAQQVQTGNMTEEEARVSPHRSVITRSLGNLHPPRVELHERPVSPGETYLFCTDGLHSYVMDEEIHDCVLRTRKLSRLGSELILMANKKGGEDNITVALLRVE